MPAVAYAEEAAADKSDGDIVVTALKRSQNVQEIPAAISAISGEDLQARGVVNVQSLTQAVPSVNFGEHAGTTLISIRSVGSTVDSGVTEPTVATYVDGVFMPRSTMGFCGRSILTVSKCFAARREPSMAAMPQAAQSTLCPQRPAAP